MQRMPRPGQPGSRPAITGRLPVSVAAPPRGWYARVVRPVPVLGELAGPWFRVQSIVARQGADSAEADFLDILPAASPPLAPGGRSWPAGCAARPERRWSSSPTRLCRTRAGQRPRPARAGVGQRPRLTLPARGQGIAGRADWLTACEALVWAPCPGRQALPLLSQPGARARAGKQAAGPVRVRACRGQRQAFRLARGGRAHRPARCRGGRAARPGNGAAPA